MKWQKGLWIVHFYLLYPFKPCPAPSEPKNDWCQAHQFSGSIVLQVRNVWKQIIGLFFGHEQDKAVMMAINFPAYGGDRLTAKLCHAGWEPIESDGMCWSWSGYSPTPWFWMICGCKMRNTALVRQEVQCPGAGTSGILSPCPTPGTYPSYPCHFFCMENL